MKLRTRGLAVAGTLALATLVACGSDDSAPGDASDRPAVSEPSANAATDAAFGWLDEQQLDLGAQADLHLALETVDDEERQQRVVDAFEAGADAYINTAYEFDGAKYSGVSSGAAAKTLYVATSADLDPTAFGAGELDLLEILADRMTPDGPSQGRLADLALKDGQPDPASNYANSFGQAYAVRGLAESEEAAADPLYESARDFLLAQQCDAGFFRLYFHPDPEAADQSCDGAEPAEESPAGDTTALVLLLLDEVAEEDPKVAAALDRAEEWLASLQDDDGSFPSEPAGAEVNTNSVGLAGWALGERGDHDAATAAAIWVRQHQLTGTECEGEATAHKGAIALTATARVDAVEHGIDDAALFEWTGATVQAAPVLAWAPPAAEKLSAESTTEGSDVRIAVSGAPGETVCATSGDLREAATLDASGSTDLQLGGVAGEPVTVTTLDDTLELEAE